mgnify:CR=1 FL=1
MNKTQKETKSIKVTQIKSVIGRNKIQKKHLLSLGLKKIGSTRLVIANNSIKGLIKKVKHLIKIEEVKSNAK